MTVGTSSHSLYSTSFHILLLISALFNSASLSLIKCVHWVHVPGSMHLLHSAVCTCVCHYMGMCSCTFLYVYNIVQCSPLAACIECTTRLINEVGTHIGILLINIPVIPQYTLRVLVFGGTIILANFSEVNNLLWLVAVTICFKNLNLKKLFSNSLLLLPTKHVF